ncbi:hypothetical protein SNE40_014025 [Patella caerulea]|uniref:Chromo domain-containing protein n=1 Tax=Patella caerulea TaxID=87958 RepID=A0AAN8JKF7_PATCE
MTLPIDITLIPKESLHADAKSYITNLLDNLKVTKEIAKVNIEKSQQSSKERYDKAAKEPKFAIGDMVLLYNPAVPKGKASKLTIKYKGPYTIIGMGPNHTYQLSDSETQVKHKSLVNHNRLKSYNIRLPIEEPDVTIIPNQVDNADNSIAEESQVDEQLPVRVNDEYQTEKTDNENTVETDRAYNFIRILRKRKYSDKVQYQILWDDKSKTWEPEENIDEIHRTNFDNNYKPNGLRRHKKKKYFTKN